MRVLSAIVHFAEQVLFGDKMQVSELDKKRAFQELIPLEEAYIRYWKEGGNKPDFPHDQSNLFFKTIHDAFQACTRTNTLLNPEVLGFRFDGWVLDGHKYPVRPWALFYFWSENFFAFHIRFQDIARGGLRTVIPRELVVEEWDKKQIFCECYDLAYTQELKNKDIPEGGSKGVIFIPYTLSSQQEEIQRKCIEAFLSMLIAGSEWVFLGPDERMSDSMLDWIGSCAKRMGYSLGPAFMTSRPNGGINHKEYGVTSFGLMVYIEEALKAVGIDPAKQKFSIKLSGGPDGDVAGNTIKFLAEKYPDTASIVAIKDVSGLLYDPFGIPFAALMPLVEKGLPIATIDLNALHEGSFLLDMRKKPLFIHGIREELDPTVANTLFDVFLHRVLSDLFIPAGGRRSSLRRENIADFMPDGIPSSRVIVEGANVYLTQEARDALESHGVLIIRDSSANKGGVISSSYEVQALLTLGEEGLLKNKDQVVQEIYQVIARLCRFEANLLLKERERQKRPASLLSSELSLAIESLTHKLLVWVQNWESPLYKKCLEAHFLPIVRALGDKAGESLTPSYIHAIIVCFIASHCIYKHGLVLPYEIRKENLDRMATESLEFSSQA